MMTVSVPRFNCIITRSLHERGMESYRGSSGSVDRLSNLPVELRKKIVNLTRQNCKEKTIFTLTWTASTPPPPQNDTRINVSLTWKNSLFHPDTQRQVINSIRNELLQQYPQMEFVTPTSSMIIIRLRNLDWNDNYMGELCNSTIHKMVRELDFTIENKKYHDSKTNEHGHLWSGQFEICRVNPPMPPPSKDFLLD